MPSVTAPPQVKIGNGGSAGHQQRFRLEIRQQPRAGRACSNGKDRRPIDPPPVLQLHIDDFDPKSSRDMDDLRDQSFMVHCFLQSASSPENDVSVLNCKDDITGGPRSERQINGCITASPFFCDEDPDPSTAPSHVSNGPYHPSTTTMTTTATQSASGKALPATFFCFSDLSIRRAGIYRLEFQLIRIRPDQMHNPTLHSVCSDLFHVVNAKDFDHVQPSTPLVRELVKRGAGFPLKLKQGSRAQKLSQEG